MADEQFPWLDWPHHYAPSNLTQNGPRVDGNSNTHWRSPFYNTLNSNTQQTSVNNNRNNTQFQYYPPCQQQGDNYVRLEDMVPYPLYPWESPSNREHQRQTSYSRSTSELLLPTSSVSQQSRKRPASHRSSDPMAQTRAGDSYTASDSYCGHNAKSRRVASSVASQSTSAVPEAAPPAFSQVRGQSAVPRVKTTSQYNFSSPSNASRTPSMTQTTTKPAAQRTNQDATRIGSQYVAPLQSRRAPQASQATQRVASPAMNDPGYGASLKRRMDLVTKLKETDAAQKLTYNPRTIARDILIAAGRHPTEASLNHHLLRLRDVFSAVELNSDLDTFNWDIVDPGEPSHALKARATRQAPVQTTQTPPQVSVHVQPPPINNTSRPQSTLHQVQLPPPPQQSQLPPQPQLQPPSQFEFRVQSQNQPAPSAASRSQPAPGTPDSMEKRRRGRPPGSSNKSKVSAPADAPPEAPASSFPVFACKWGNCQAELHNLDLLKKHLFKNHVSYQITCGWKGCAFTGTLPAAMLMKHVKEEHLDTLAFKLGDGPAVPTSVDQDLSSNTVPVTIPEYTQPGNEDSLIFPADYGSIRAFNRVHGNNTQQGKAREIFKAVQRLKERIGIGLDPGGCELATPMRNERVSDEEDVYEVQPGP